MKTNSQALHRAMLAVALSSSVVCQLVAHIGQSYNSLESIAQWQRFNKLLPWRCCFFWRWQYDRDLQKKTYSQVIPFI